MTKRKNTHKERISKLHENLVVSFDEGDCLGNVGEIYIDKQTCRIKGISLTSKFLEPGDKNFVKFEDILKLGNSVVIVSGEAALGMTPKGSGSSPLRILNGIKIVTQEGEHLGEMADLNVVAETGVIQDILVYGDRKIPVDVKKDQIRIGPDMIVVPAAYKGNITPCPPKESEDNFADVVKSAGEVTRKFADTLSAAVQKMAGLTKLDKAEADKDKANARSKADSGKKLDGIHKSTTTASPVGAKKTATKKAKPAKKAAAAKKATTVKKNASGTKDVSAKKSTAIKKDAPVK